MIEALEWIVGVPIYTTVWMLWARKIYGTERANKINNASYGIDPVKDFNRYWKQDYKIGCILFAFPWPVTLPGTLAFQWMSKFLDSTPVKSQTEINQERDQQDKHIHDLERQLLDLEGKKGI
jgi:hypothetical protein